MPLTHTSTFRVRHYECDTYGHLNNVNYVRYMQETALDASAAVGWHTERYAGIGRQWLVRETEIEYRLPLLYGETARITTWVEDFRRVRSRRRYDFHRVGDEAHIASAVTDWVFLDSATGRPATVPEEVIRAYLPPDEQPQTTERARFPVLSPPDGAFRLRRRIEWRDIDTVGHANNAAYFSFFEDASTQVGRVYGWSMARLQAEGIAMLMRRFQVQYLAPAVLDDEVEVATWFTSARRATVQRHYTLTRPADGLTLAHGIGLWVVFDLARQRPMRAPEALLSDFAPNRGPDNADYEK